MDRHGLARGVFALFALAAVAVYAWLRPPYSGMGDSSELTLVLATNGVAHPPGYPLYTLFGHLFVTMLHGLGMNWAPAASLWSGVGTGVALVCLGRLAMELVGWLPGSSARLQILAPLAPLLLFAFQPIVLDESTRAEINAWTLAWACVTSWQFARTARVLAGEDPSRHPRRDAALWGLVCGAGVAHHPTSVLVSAPLTAALIAIAVRRRRLSATHVAAGVFAALVPVAGYGIIAWRAWHPARFQWPLLEPGWASVIAHLTAAEYRHFLGRFAPSEWERGLLVGAVLPFLLPGLALLAFGVWRAREAWQRIAWAALLAAALMVTLFASRYGVFDPGPYFLPAMALGVAAAGPAIASLPGAGSRAGSALLGAVGLASLVVVVPWIRDGIEQRQATTAYEKVIRSMWSSIPPDTAIVSWPDDRFNRLREYQVLRGEKPAVIVVTPDLLLGGVMRRTVRERWGVDPRELFRPVHVPAGAPDEQLIREARRALMQRLNDRIPIPVILFDPEVPIVWQFKKPWERAPGQPSSFPPSHPPIPGTARRSLGVENAPGPVP